MQQHQTPATQLTIETQQASNLHFLIWEAQAKPNAGVKKEGRTWPSSQGDGKCTERPWEMLERCKIGTGHDKEHKVGDEAQM